MAQRSRRKRAAPAESPADAPAVGGAAVTIDPTWPASLRWACEFLPHYFAEEPAPFHADLMRVLEDPQRRLVARVAPRGHAKSTCAALAFPLWCLCTRRCTNIVIITYESALARQFVRDLRQELEENPGLRATYGDLGGCSDDGCRTGRRRPWSETCFRTSTGSTVHARGTGAGLRGLRVGPHRPDLIICDDLEHDAHVASGEQRQKLARWLQRAVLPALAPRGRLLLLGSLLHHDSLLARLRDRREFPGWDYAVYRALEATPGPDGRFHRVALWPARWPIERLDEERERIGSVAFDQEYQAQPAADEVRVFRREWLRTYDPARLVPERLTHFIAVDPATGRPGGDYFALWAGGVDGETRVIYTRELTLRSACNPTQQVAAIIEACARWRPVRIGIESNAYQFALKHAVAEESRRLGLALPIEAVHSSRNKRLRVEGSVPAYECGQFYLPPGLDPAIEAQFLEFPHGKFDDAPDVCAMGIALVRDSCAGRIAGRTPVGARGPAQHGW